MNLEEYEDHLTKKQKLVDHIRAIKAKYDKHHQESQVKLIQIKEIKNKIVAVQEQLAAELEKKKADQLLKIGQ